MEVSALLLQQRPWPELRARAERWDASGARAIYVADHLRGSPHAPGSTWLDAFPLLGALTAVTRRIRLGTLVSAPTLREPVLLALAARSLDELSDGRFELGIGAGGRPSDSTMRGIDAPDPREAADAFLEAIALIEPLLRGEAVTSNGPRFPVRNARLVGGCVQTPRLPLHLAAHGMRTLDAVARLGDAWNLSGDRHGDRASQLETARRLAAALDERLEVAGRRREEVRRSVLVGVSPGLTYTSLEELRELAGAFAALGFSELIVYDPPFALDGGPAAPPEVIDELLADPSQLVT